jgi:enoyl-CoA hydratase/carnithine racemase
VKTQDLLFDVMPGKGGGLGIITLNRPTALNALNHDMNLAIRAQLREWAPDPAVKAILVCSVGRAFCAGGDLRLTYERYADKSALETFFYHEYQLNRDIFHYPKPYIALLDGITMGGGVGLAIHGPYRIATERLLFAMPETGIGFFTDVGGTYFLPRLRGRLGFYLGLSGARLAFEDCVSLGIATGYVPHECLERLIQQLSDEVFDDPHQAVQRVLNRFYLMPAQGQLLQHQAALDACFSGDTVENILDALRQSDDHFCNAVGETINKHSPTSLKVTLLALQKGKTMDFDACMTQEYRLACHFIQRHDFMEGIRAVIIDKDGSPVWQPASLAEVSSEAVAGYFSGVANSLT